MKKIIIILFSVSMLLVVTSCNPSGSTTPVNTIRAAKLTPEQQDILDLFSNNQEFMIFDYNTDEPFSRFEVWVEVYENGELVDRPAELITVRDSGETRNGRLAISISQNDNTYGWMLSMLENGGKASHIGMMETAVGSGLGRAFGPMIDPASIEDGKEIIIYSSIFHTFNTPQYVYGEQTLQERPELLLDYPYVHLIKAIFTK